jgi:hypothetical protein
LSWHPISSERTYSMAGRGRSVRPDNLSRIVRCRRALKRVAFGEPLAEQTVTLERMAEARMKIEQARLLTLKAAYMMDTVGRPRGRKSQ